MTARSSLWVVALLCGWGWAWTGERAARRAETECQTLVAALEGASPADFDSPQNARTRVGVPWSGRQRSSVAPEVERRRAASATRSTAWPPRPEAGEPEPTPATSHHARVRSQSSRIDVSDAPRSNPIHSVGEAPEFLTARLRRPPQLIAWVEGRTRTELLFGFEGGPEVWLREGESYRGFSVVHAEAGWVVTLDHATRRSRRWRLPSQRSLPNGGAR